MCLSNLRGYTRYILKQDVTEEQVSLCPLGSTPWHVKNGSLFIMKDIGGIEDLHAKRVVQDLIVED